MKYFEKIHINLFFLIASFIAIHFFSHFEQHQTKIYFSMLIAIILWLISIREKVGRIGGVFLLACILITVDSFIGFTPGISTTTKTWAEQSATVSLAIFFSIIFVLQAVKDEKIEHFYNAILVLAGVIILTGLYELFYLKTQPGRIITGYQNISSSILLIAIPLLNRVNFIKFSIKLILVIIILLTIILIFKSRFSGIIAILCLLVYALSRQELNWYYKLGFISLFIFAVLGTFSLVDRFSGLINGNDLWVRIFIWERLLNAGSNSFLFGMGFGNIPIITSSWQFINPSVELITTFNTFFSAHNDLLERFIYGGIISVTISLYINILIFYGFFKKRKFYLKNEILIYLILLLHSLIDIHNSNFASLVIFNFFQFYLIYRIYDASSFDVINLKYFILSLLAPSFFIIYKYNELVDYVKDYQITTNNMIVGNFIEGDIRRIENQTPHFMRFDFIDMQTYLMYKSQGNFNKVIFEGKLLTTRRYNKYYLPQIHISSQYYSYINDQNNLLSIYSDFLYYKLVNLRLINISLKATDVQVKVIDNKFISFSEGEGKYTLFIPKHVFLELMRVNSSFGLAKLSNEFLLQNLNDFNYTGHGDRVEVKIAIKEFLEGVNSFSDKFIFK